MSKKTIKYKEPRIKKFAQTRKARAPISTYSDFWNTPIKLGKKKKTKVIIQETKEVSFEAPAREEHDAGIIPSSMPRLKRAKNLIILTDKQGNKRFIWKDSGKKRYAYPIHDPQHDPLAKARNENMDKYKQRLNMGFTSKRHYGRFTQNPREPRGIAVIEVTENPISNVRYNKELVDHVRQKLLKKD